eukprot:superscaffoldBa00002476_g14401
MQQPSDPLNSTMIPGSTGTRAAGKEGRARREKTNKVEQQRAVPSLSLPSLLPILALELVANLKGPPPIPKERADITHPCLLSTMTSGGTGEGKGGEEKAQPLM